MPMGGRGSRFFEKGIVTPKPLIEIHGKPYFYWAVQSIKKFVTIEQLIFVVLEEHERKYQITKCIKSLYPSAEIVLIPDVLNGPVLTSLEGIKHINNNKGIVINDCDHAFKSQEFYNFFHDNDLRQKIGGALLTFKSQNPNFSYIAYDQENNITGTVEKKVVSSRAICGSYYFQNKATFLNAAQVYLNECEYKEYFVSGLFNTIIAQGKTVESFNVDFHLPFGTPEEYYLAKNSDLFWGLV
ncbi:dolichyl-phosphate mannose synthase [Paenibacillus sp. Soil766]|nr:dolichyl-phosphate mannose synthase [Paenibacillus sp. Soil766]